MVADVDGQPDLSVRAPVPVTSSQISGLQLEGGGLQAWEDNVLRFFVVKYGQVRFDGCKTGENHIDTRLSGGLSSDSKAKLRNRRARPKLISSQNRSRRSV